MPHKLFIFLILGFLTLTLICAQPNPQSFKCTDHDWQNVQDLVVPFLDEEMQTGISKIEFLPVFIVYNYIQVN